jgi:hypothetical protein
MARKHRFRFGFPDVFVGRLLWCRVGVGDLPIHLLRSPEGALGSELFVSSCRDRDMRKPAIGFPDAGL